MTATAGYVLRLAQNRAPRQVPFGVVRLRLTRGDAKAGNEHYNPVPREIGQWIHLVAAAKAESRASGQKNGTSAPSVAATSVNCAGRSGTFQIRANPTSAAAASALPPPRPACNGIRFSSRTPTSRMGPLRRSAPQRFGGPPDQI